MGPEERLDAFVEAVGGPATQQGCNTRLRCPVHADEHPSLDIAIGENGGLMVICRAGCRTEDVVAAIGWKMADLMPPREDPAGKRPNSKTKPKKVYPNLDAIAAAAARSMKGKVESTHVYKNAQEQPVFAVIRVRRENGSKDIPQVRPEAGSWVFGGVKDARPLYRLSALLAAHADIPVSIFEGEQKADLAASIGFNATSCSQGAGNARLTDFSPLANRVVHVFADNDTAGQGHMDDVAARAFAQGATSVWNVTLPSLPPKGDIVDFCRARREAGLDDAAIADEIRDAIAQATEVAPPRDEVGDEVADETVDEPGEAASQLSTKLADTVVAMARDADLFHDEQGDTYATITVNGHRETWRVSSRQFALWLGGRAYRELKVAVPPQTMTTAINTLHAAARFDGGCLPVFSRIARVDGSIWIDLSDEAWRAIKVTTSGWHVVDKPVIRFVRRGGMRPLPIPGAGLESLDRLFDLLQVEDPAIRILVTAWLVNAIVPSSSYPILSLTGEQGSGKSTFCRALQRLVDPHKVEGRSPPRNEEDIAVAAQQAHVLVYENLSSISVTLSDALCRVATGAGFAARKLYTDDEERQLAFCRPVIINGIGDLTTRSDLADRVVSIHLEPIPRERRKTEGALWRAFDALQPQLFGALLGLVGKVIGMANMDVPLERMADYSLLGAKVAVALGMSADAFTSAYGQNRDSSSLVALESSAIGPVLLRLVRKEPVRCPIGSLLFELQKNADKHEARHPDWPNTPRALGNELRRLAPNLTRIGITVTFPPRRKDGMWVEIEGALANDVHQVHHAHQDGCK